MIASHPNIIAVALLIAAILCHVKIDQYNPIGGEGFKSDYKYDDISFFKFFIALKWMAIGAVVLIATQQQIG